MNSFTLFKKWQVSTDISKKSAKKCNDPILWNWPCMKHFKVCNEILYFMYKYANLNESPLNFTINMYDFTFKFCNVNSHFITKFCCCWWNKIFRATISNYLRSWCYPNSNQMIQHNEANFVLIKIWQFWFCSIQWKIRNDNFGK